MPFNIQLETALEKKLQKLKKRDNFLYQRVIHKITEIAKILNLANHSETC